jgi:hypothetical protein
MTAAVCFCCADGASGVSMEQVAAFDKLREGGISALVRLERAVKSFADAARRDPSGDHAGEQKDMTVSLQHCNDRVEAIRTSSLKCWPGIAVRRSSGAYRDTVDDEVSLEDAIDSLSERAADAITFWRLAVRNWTVGLALPPSFRKQDFGWVEYVMVAVQDCEKALERERVRTGAL